MFIMNRARLIAAAAVLAAAFTPAAFADDLSGTDRLLCAAIEATRCDLDGC